MPTFVERLTPNFLTQKGREQAIFKKIDQGKDPSRWHRRTTNRLEHNGLIVFDSKKLGYTRPPEHTIDLSLRQIPKFTDEETKENFIDTKNGVLYFSEMPKINHLEPNQTVVPLDNPAVKRQMENKLQEKGQILMDINSSTGAISKDGFWRFQPAAIVSFDKEGKIDPLYHTVVWKNGAIDPGTELPTPGVVTASLQLRELDGKMTYFVHFTYQFRPVPFDPEKTPIPPGLNKQQRDAFIAANRGGWFPTFAGGFGEVGKTTEETAMDENNEETPWIKISEPKHSSYYSDRATTQGITKLGHATYKPNPNYTEESQTGDEVFSGRYAVPVNKFRSPDLLVMGALHTALLDEELISASPRETTKLPTESDYSFSPENGPTYLKLLQ